MDEARDMSDYESALSAAVSVLISAVLDLGGDQGALVERLEAHREEFKISGNVDAAAVMTDLVTYAKESGRAPEFRGGPAPVRKARAAKKRPGRASTAAKKRGGASPARRGAGGASKARSASGKSAKGRGKSR